MNQSKIVFLHLFFVLVGIEATASYAERSPTEILMKATTLACTFTSEQQTQWSSGGPVKEEGMSQDKVRFLSINHKAGEA